MNQLVTLNGPALESQLLIREFFQWASECSEGKVGYKAQPMFRDLPSGYPEGSHPRDCLAGISEEYAMRMDRCLCKLGELSPTAARLIVLHYEKRHSLSSIAKAWRLNRNRVMNERDMALCMLSGLVSAAAA